MAQSGEEARKKSFRTFASEELNRPAKLGKVCKILRKMEGGVQAPAPGRAISGDHGREAVADRSKAEAFVATYARVSRQIRNKKVDRIAKAKLRTLRRAHCSCGDHRSTHCQPFSLQEITVQLRKLKPHKAPGPDGICANTFSTWVR